jgi:hypothetical protein
MSDAVLCGRSQLAGLSGSSSMNMATSPRLRGRGYRRARPDCGDPNRGIAAELYVTLDTVKKHVGRVLDKLGAANRTEAAARALQLGRIG